MAAVEQVAQLIEDLDPGCVVLKFVVVAEVIGPDGRRDVWQATDEGATRWDTYGLLHQALEETRALHHIAASYATYEADRDLDQDGD